MMNFEFDYRGHEIQVFNTYSGREKVYLDGELVSSKMNWSFNGEHELTVEDEALTIKIHVLSALRGEVKVCLYKDKELLETRSQSCSVEVMSEGQPQFDQDELQWKSEIEMADSTTWMMYALYFGLILYSVLSVAFDNELYGLLALGFSAFALLAAIVEFIRTCVRELKSADVVEEPCATE